MTDGRQVGLVYDPLFLEHRGPEEHPECPARLAACVQALQQAGLWQQLRQIPARPASWVEVEAVHEPAYLDLLARLPGGSGFLDPDTYYSPRSVEAAWLAAGATTELALQVLRGELDAGLALVRPPGHHARRGSSEGFCLLANLAVAAAAVRARGERLAVVDFDVHHGDGTQEAFAADSELLFISLHRFDGLFFPASGQASEQGCGPGVGATINVPLSPGAGNTEYLAAFDQLVGPALARFRPALLLVSAGFDAHREDPLGGMTVDDQGFGEMIERLRRYAAALCAGRWVAVLEGGYDLAALGRGVVQLARALLDQKGPQC